MRGGVSQLWQLTEHLVNVFPTCVGVFLPFPSDGDRQGRLPHVRGGVSSSRLDFSLYLRSSPRAWGCFLRSLRIETVQEVFPTCVGVFLEAKERYWLAMSLPHVRGGVSTLRRIEAGIKKSSPRAWGCFSVLTLSWSN